MSSDKFPVTNPETPWVAPDQSTVAGRAPSDSTDSRSVTRHNSTDMTGQDTLGIGPEVTRRRPVLVVIDGKRVSDRCIMRKSSVVIGRETEADLTLADGRVSRTHAQVVWENYDNEAEEPYCVLSDLDSRNGTIVNGQRVARQPLRDGDRILIGTTLIGFYVKDEQELTLDQQLLAMATTDSLTGLANRLFFQTEMRREIDRARRYQRHLSLIVLDLDHFKRINDTHGHAAGDLVLRKLARILVVTMRDGDVVGRLGGEEFGILLPETDLPGAAATAERLRRRVESFPFRFKEEDIRVTISLGVARYAPEYPTREAFMEVADKALYQAKAQGRNRVIVGGTGEMPSLPETTPPPPLNPKDI